MVPSFCHCFRIPSTISAAQDLEAALTFIRSFPDCSSWNILLLDQERKNALVHRPQLSTQALLAELSVPCHSRSRCSTVKMSDRHKYPAYTIYKLFVSALSMPLQAISNHFLAVFIRTSQSLCFDHAEVWMKLPCHFFIRPNLNSVVMIDLDNFTGSLSKLLQLHPRALVQTSRQSYQLWLTLDQRHQARDAQIVTQELTKALGGDPCSARITQVGRLPGSINRKPEKQCHTHLLYSGLANLDEAQYLQLTSNPQMRLQHGSVQTDSAPPKRDISRDDWREACHFFESNPQATLEDAIQHCPLLAKRGNQAHPTGFLTIVYRFCSQPSYITFNKSCLILPMCDNRYFTLVMLPSPCFIASSRCALRDLCFTHHSAAPLFVRTTTPD